MHKFLEKTNKLGKVEEIATCLTGVDLLNSAVINKGAAFTQEEREHFGLLGKLPPHIETLDEQLARIYIQFQQQPTSLAKNLYLNNLKQNNLTLFYALVKKHLLEMMPIIYTPTIAEAVENFSYEFNKPSGLIIDYPNRHLAGTILGHRVHRELDLIIVTDGEGVLGIGDWGLGGMDICIGKLMVYTVIGGINPRRVLPIQLDVGTNNEKLLNDPMYLGWRHERISGKEYDKFIGDVVSAIQEKFPGIYLHWEDFGRENARRNLNRYRNDMCTFNDDIQGTGATALASILSGLRVNGTNLGDQRIVFFGAGTAGVGIADQIAMGMVQQGCTEEQARRNIWLIDRPGLLVDSMDGLLPFQKPYARPAGEVSDWTLMQPDYIGLADVVENVKPTVLIGCSTVKGAFTEEIVKNMAKHTERPLIFPLSNPTSRSEAVPEDLFKWTDCKAIIATGSPFQAIQVNDQTMDVAQCNNAYIFPGLGLGVIAASATRVTDGMISAACHALADHSPAIKDPTAPILPKFTDMNDISKKIALAVANEARSEGVSDAPDDLDFAEKIDAIFWEPEYLPYEKL